MSNNISIPLKLFLDLVIGHRFDGFTVLHGKTYAALVNSIKESDKEELYCHIQLLDNGDYKVWLINDWRISEERYKKQKEESSKRIETYAKNNRNLARLTFAIQEMTSLDVAQCEMMANRILNTNPAKAINFGVTLET